MNLKYLIILLILITSVTAINVTEIDVINVNIRNIDRIFAYENEIFVSHDVETSIWIYEIDYEKGELDRLRRIGSDFIDVRDIYIEGDIAYILDSGSVYKFNHKERRQLFRGDSDSYFPSYAQAIAIEENGEYIYLADRSNNRINIMQEYVEDKYLAIGSISTSTHGMQASFDNLFDLVIYDGKMYALDSAREQIVVFESKEPYKFINILARGRGGFSTEKPSKIEVDELFIYILENKRRVTLMDKMSGEKVLSIVPDCEFGIHDFSFDNYNDRIYVLCQEREDLYVYEVDKRTTKTEQQVENLLKDVNERIKISCEIYEAAKYFNLNIQNKCEEFTSLVENYEYENYNDAFDELSVLMGEVRGYNSGVKPIVDNRIMLNVSYYMNEMMENVPYTGTRNYTATRIIWDLNEVLEFKSKSEYYNVIEKMEITLGRYEDFINGREIVEEEEESEEREIQETNEYINIKNEFDYYKPLLEEYEFFVGKIVIFQENIIDYEEGKISLEELEEELEKLKSEFYEYRENYNKVSENIERVEEEFTELKNKWFVEIDEIEILLKCARGEMENNPKEAWVCLLEAEELIEKENEKTDNYFFLGLFLIGSFVVGLIFIILVGLGLYKFIKK